MTKIKQKRHMSAAEITLSADWIVAQSDLPSWAEVRSHVLREYGIDRTVEALRRIPGLKKARDSRANVKTSRRVVGSRPTTRKLNILQEHVDRLEAESQLLQNENIELIERNLRLTNGARVHQIPEADLDRSLAPMNRNPTKLPSRKQGK